VPSFGDWGFLLAAAGENPPPLALAPDRPGLRFLDPPTLAASAVFPADRGRLVIEPSTLMHPRVLEYARAEWRRY
jgi:spermidine synthase